jgi:TonB-linked SusC/RagA family outer membrane protein
MPSSISAQESISLEGTVHDESGLPLLGVTILIKGTATGTVTNFDGEFSIDAKEGNVLEFSYMGFQKQSIQINNTNDLKIILKTDVGALDEIVIVGFGAQKKESVVGAIGQISSQNLESVPVTNISNALVGQTAGITSTQSTGELGNESSDIRIRGVGTYVGGNQSPLFVIDGLIRDAASFNALDVYDVSGINILKDASATAVYGVRGANGVIIVTTKRGKGGVMPPQVTVTSNFGFATPTTLPRLVNSYTWATLMNEAILNDGQVLENNQYYSTPDELWKFQNNRDYTPAEVAAMNNLSDEQKQQLLNSPAIYYGNTDYFKKVFDSQVAPVQRYNVNVSGGTEDVSYYTSVGYSKQTDALNDFGIDSYATNTKYEKFNVRTNLDINSIKNTKIQTFMSAYVHQGDQLGGSSQEDFARYKGLIYPMYMMAPWFGPGVIDGKVVYSNANLPGDMLRKMDGWAISPIANLLDKNSSQITRTNIDLSVKAEHELNYLLPGLKLRGTLSFVQNSQKTVDRNDRIATYQIARSPENPNDILYFGGVNNTELIEEAGRNSGGWSKNRRFYVDGGISYDKTFGNHSVSALTLLTAERFISQGLRYNIPRGIYGLVGRVTYDYDSRYLLEFNIGYNGSENFAEGKRFGTFPAASAGWVVSNEDFFPESSFLTWLKFRGSYGEVGNSNIGGDRFLYLPGQWSGTNDMGGTYFFGNADGISGANTSTRGIFESSVGNPLVTWETKTSYNIGLETRLFDDKLSITMDYFNEVRTDILSRIETTPSLIGLENSSLPLYNIGQVTNKGFEFESSWNGRIGKDFTYNLSGNFSYAVNKIDYRAEIEKLYPWMMSTGFSVGQFKGFKSDGLFNTAEELANRPVNSFNNNNAQLGDIRFVDIDGDGIIDDNDRVPIGFSSIPRWNFAFAPRLNYKGWGVSLQFVGSAQGTFQMNGSMRSGFGNDYNPATPFEFQTERWTQERYDNGEKISHPRLSANPLSTPSIQDSDYWLRSTDFLKLKNVELSYNFGKVAMKKIKLKGLRVYANANNVHTWMFGDLRDDIDPEQANSGNGQVNQGWIYPLSRVYNFGLSVNF